MTKEILIKGEPTRQAALGKLRQLFQDYRAARGVQSWRWLNAPEAMTDGRTWRAYARMVADKPNLA